MPKKKSPPLPDSEQKKRFEKIAKETGATASAKELREVLEKVARSTVSKEDGKG